MRNRILIRGVILAVFCIIASEGLAQQFSVRHFRQLTNDITAYISPVRDLNGDACALVKVVGDRDFVFSTPLGVVKMRHDVGEILIYVPQGTKMITLKHPEWGILRDYHFPTPLESRMTYEMVVASPIVIKEPVVAPMAGTPTPPDTMRVIPSCTLPTMPTARIKKPLEPLRYMLMANIGIGGNRPSLGLRAVAMRRYGAYLLVQTDLHSMPKTDGDCKEDGALSYTNDTPYYTGITKEGRAMILAGSIQRIAGDFCLYEGVGYGKRIVGWETIELEMMRNTSYSAEGICAELGAMYRFKRLAISAGVLTIGAKHWEATVGIGVRL